MKVTIEPFYADQQQVKVYGRRVAYCGTRENMPVCFLTEAKNQCGLTPEEKTEVLQAVIDSLGSVRKTPQTSRYLPEERHEPGSDD